MVAPHMGAWPAESFAIEDGLFLARISLASYTGHAQHEGEESCAASAAAHWALEEE
jgi:hypothetical protein